MKLPKIVLYLSVCGACLHLHGQQAAHRPVPDYPVPQGVSAPFAGFAGHWLITGGGCNFPHTPAAEGGSKVFYNQVHALDLTSSSPQWIPLPPLPQPAAYGATVSTGDGGIVCIGGQNAQSGLADVYKIGRTADGNGFSLTRLPSLPETIDNGAAAITGNRLYVTGGNQQRQGNSLYMLDLSQPLEWKKLADYPGARRTQPILLATPDALFLIGGFEQQAQEKTCTLSTDILRYDIRNNQWAQHDTIVPEQDGTPRCLAGGSGTVHGDKFILTGGVNYRIFKAALEGKAPKDYMKKSPSWYRFNDDLLVYDYRKKTWQVKPDVPGMAKAGGILLLHDRMLYMVCGEVKPGIRTPQVVTCPLPEEE